MRSIFLDRDGVINENLPEHVKCWDEFVFLPQALVALRWLRQAGFRVFVVTNQAIVSRGLTTAGTIEDIHTRMRMQVELYGGRITAVRYCPHDTHEQCACRKPRPGMLLDLAKKWQIDLPNTYMIGDALTDVAAGQAVNCKTVLVKTGRGAAQSALPEANVYHPDHVAADLLEAVRWVFRQEGLTIPTLEHDTLVRKPALTIQPVSAILDYNEGGIPRYWGHGT